MFGKKANNDIPKTPDGRKYRMAIICLLVLLAGFALAGVNPVFAKLYAELITAVLGVQAVYSGLNVANKYAISKKGDLTPPQAQPKVENGVSNDGPVS